MNTVEDKQEALREIWLRDRAQDLRQHPYQLVKALNDIHGEDLFACLHTLIIAARLDLTKATGSTQTVIEGWITMVLQDEDARGEWRGYEPD